MYLSKREAEYSIRTEDKIDVIEFQSPIPSGIEKVDKAKAFLFKSNDSKKSVVFIHGTGQRNFDHLKYYPLIFSKSGYATLMPILPYHFERTPEGQKSGLAFIKGTDKQLAKRFDQTVTEVLTWVDYLEKYGFNEINIMGFSFGGMIATISMAIDKRIRKGSFVVTGGNYEYITWHSVATKVLRVNYEENKSCTPIVCNIKHRIFERMIEEFSELEDLEKMHPCFTYDPSIFAKFIKPENVIFFEALFDLFIPKKSSRDLWERMGKPRRYELLSGHLTSHLFFRHFIANKTLEFFKEE
ncbi:alpha/beta hydrolase family protein [Athalassotoga sp.]|uniref:alpha/beta hydrolase family protein n=1 Tax=Athalassotoga sp. TaxID=2022597 RepID=UPI003D06F2CF